MTLFSFTRTRMAATVGVLSLSVLAVALALPGRASAAPVTPWVQAGGGHFVDNRTGKTVLLRGFDVSVGDSNLYQKAKTVMGANFVRLTPSWEEIEPTAPAGGVHTYDQTYLGYLDSQVAWYEANNVNVLIDVHQSGWSSYFAPVSDGTARGMPTWLYQGKYPVTTDAMAQAKADFFGDPQIKSWYSDLLTMLVNRYSSHPNVVGFEIINEPQPGAIDSEQATQTLVDWQSGLAHMVSSLDPQATIFFMTRGGADYGLEDADLTGFGDLPHVALDVHNYFNGVGGLSQDGEDWLPSYNETHNQFSTNYKGSIDQQEGNLVRTITVAQARSWPLLVGEWGGRVDDTGLSSFQSQLLTLFDRYRLSWTRWNLSTTGIFATLSDGKTPNAGGAQIKTALASTPTGLANDGVPRVSGTPAFGTTLTATKGQWTGSISTTTYQWYRCDAAGNSCVAISGATSSSYKSANADAGARLRVRVNVTGSAGSSTALSAATDAAPALPPTNSSAPAVIGKTMAGEVLTSDAGTWTGRVSTYSYQWMTCDAGGANCTPIPNATKSSYTVKTADIGDRLVASVTATGPGGSTAANSATTPAVAAIPIVSSSLPTTTGAAAAGTQLAADKGTWTGTIDDYSYQWLSCDASGNSCVAVAGATSSRYTLQDGDVGHAIRVQVTATGPGGSLSVKSAATAKVADQAPKNTAAPTLAGTAKLGHGYCLSIQNGKWDGSNLVYTYRWKRLDANGQNGTWISGATAKSYKLTSDDLGKTLKGYITATNPVGSVEVATALSAVVTQG